MINVIQTIKSKLQTAIMYAFRIFPIQNNKVLFQSYYGEAYNDNPMMISEKLIDKNIDIVWATTKKLECPACVRQVNTSTVRYFYELATSKVWVDNCRKRDWVRKRKNQYYIQTWHGNLTNKKGEGASLDTLPPEYIRKAKRDASMSDLMISGSAFFTDLIRKYFWYDGEILECGTPRLDKFFTMTEESCLKIKESLGIGATTRVALYAPTFRADMRTDCYALDFDKLLSTLDNWTNNHWVVLVRLHPNVANKTDFVQYSSTVINVTTYPDLYELIYLSDIVISDYSSLTFEAGLLLKPVFLFTLDLDQYIKERGFYIDIHDQPYLLAENNEELIQLIVEYESAEYVKRLKAFNESLGIMENGNASSTIADRIMEVMQGKR